MEKEKKRFLSKISDATKIKIIRWWCAAAVYFFIGWGTSLGNQDTPYDLIIVLGVVIGVVNVFMIHPIIYSMFDIERKGKILNKKYYERTILEGVWHKLGEILKCLFCSILVFVVYQLLNMMLVTILNKPSNQVIIPGEPVLYGLLFLGWYLLVELINNKIKDAIEDRKEKKQNKELVENKEG